MYEITKIMNTSLSVFHLKEQHFNMTLRWQYNLFVLKIKNQIALLNSSHLNLKTNQIDLWNRYCTHDMFMFKIKQINQIQVVNSQQTVLSWTLLWVFPFLNNLNVVDILSIKPHCRRHWIRQPDVDEINFGATSNK